MNISKRRVRRNKHPKERCHECGGDCYVRIVRCDRRQEKQRHMPVELGGGSAAVCIVESWMQKGLGQRRKRIFVAVDREANRLGPGGVASVSMPASSPVHEFSGPQAVRCNSPTARRMLLSHFLCGLIGTRPQKRESKTLIQHSLAHDPQPQSVLWFS